MKFLIILALIFCALDGRYEARMKSLEELKKACPHCTFKILDCDKRGRVFADEMRILFPLGTDHLPEKIKTGGIYCLTSACEKKVQYAGKKHQGKYIFAVFIVVDWDE